MIGEWPLSPNFNQFHFHLARWVRLHAVAQKVYIAVKYRCTDMWNFEACFLFLCLTLTNYISVYSKTTSEFLFVYLSFFNEI